MTRKKIKRYHIFTEDFTFVYERESVEKALEIHRQLHACGEILSIIEFDRLDEIIEIMQNDSID